MNASGLVKAIMDSGMGEGDAEWVSTFVLSWIKSKRPAEQEIYEDATAVDEMMGCNASPSGYNEALTKWSKNMGLK